MFSNYHLNKRHNFTINNTMPTAYIELIRDPNSIDQLASRQILVEAFIGEYKQYLTPQEVSTELTSWRDGNASAQKYYENYFTSELNEFTNGHLHYWVQAKVDEKVVGWATFEREKSDPNAVYMNLLVVHPDYQHKGIGKELVMSLINLHEIENLSAVHLLLRKKNQGGRTFYSKLGFYSDPEYQRDENFVNLDLLEGLTWKNPDLQLRGKMAAIS